MNDRAPAEQSRGYEEERIAQEAEALLGHWYIDDVGPPEKELYERLDAVLQRCQHVPQVEPLDGPDRTPVRRIDMSDIELSQLPQLAQQDLVHAGDAMLGWRERTDDQYAGETLSDQDTRSCQLMSERHQATFPLARVIGLPSPNLLPS